MASKACHSAIRCAISHQGQQGAVLLNLTSAFLHKGEPDARSGTGFSWPHPIHECQCGVDRFGDVLNTDQCEELLDNLKRTRSWHCCAHGRPTVAPLVDVPALQRVIALRGFPA